MFLFIHFVGFFQHIFIIVAGGQSKSATVSEMSSTYPSSTIIYCSLYIMRIPSEANIPSIDLTSPPE